MWYERLSPVMLVVLFALVPLACGDGPANVTGPAAKPSATSAASTSAGVSGPTAPVRGAARARPLRPDEVRTAFSDPWVRGLVAGLDDPGLRASVESALEPLSTLGDDTAEPFSLRRRSAREALEEAADGDLTADDGLVLAVLHLVLGDVRSERSSPPSSDGPALDLPSGTPDRS